MLLLRAHFRAFRTEAIPFVLIANERIRTVIKTAVARRYAKALFELLDQSNIEATRGTLNGLGQAIKESFSLRHVVASPAFGAEEKIAVLTELGVRLGCPPVGKAFLGQLVKKNRVRFLPDIAEAFAKLVDAVQRHPASDRLLRSDITPSGTRSNQARACARCSSARSMSPFRPTPSISPVFKSALGATWSIAPSVGG